MASAKPKAAARRNIKKAATAAKRKKTICATRSAAGMRYLAIARHA